MWRLPGKSRRRVRACRARCLALARAPALPSLFAADPPLTRLSPLRIQSLPYPISLLSAFAVRPRLSP